MFPLLHFLFFYFLFFLLLFFFGANKISSTMTASNRESGHGVWAINASRYFTSAPGHEKEEEKRTLWTHLQDVIYQKFSV